MDKGDGELFAEQMREAVNDCWESSDFLYRLHQAIDLYDMVYGQYEDSFLINRYGKKKELTQSKARNEELENRIDEMEAFTSAGYHMDKYNEMKARIRELTFIVKNAPDEKRMHQVRRLYLLEQQHRRDGEKIRELEDETNSLRMQNSVLMDVVKVPFLAKKKQELSIFQKWEMSLLMMRDMIHELYGENALSEKSDKDGAPKLKEVVCPECNGSKMEWYSGNWAECHECGGTGYAPEKPPQVDKEDADGEENA